MLKDSERRSTCCYEYLDANNDVVYVGISAHPDERWKQHKAHAHADSWVHLAVRRVDHWFSTRSEAEARERARIYETRETCHNIAGTSREPDLARLAAARAVSRQRAEIRAWGDVNGFGSGSRGELRSDLVASWAVANPHTPLLFDAGQSASAYKRRNPLGPRARELGGLMKYARVEAGWTSEWWFAADNKLGQSTVSRVENGVLLPSKHVVERWLASTNVDPSELACLLEAARAREPEELIRLAASRPSGVSVAPEEVPGIEAASNAILQYEPSMIPRLAQTSAYSWQWLAHPSRVHLPSDDPTIGFELQERRRAQVRDSGQRLTIAINQHALHASYGDEQVLAAQVESLHRRAEAGEIELLVSGSASVADRGFTLLDGAVLYDDEVSPPRLISCPDVVGRFANAVSWLRAS